MTQIKNLDKKKLILFAAGGIGLIVIAALFLKTRALSGQLIQNKVIIGRMQQQTQAAAEEKKAIEQEKEKLQADTLSYLELNTSLEQDKKKLENALEKSKDILEDKEEELQKAKLELQRYEEKVSRQESEYKSKFEKESRELKDAVKNLEEALQKERGLYHYNLAVSYTQASLFDQAVEAYEKSLEIAPDNPEAHYNLGMLYLNFKNNPERALGHYRKYLELEPDAEDKEEVEAWIKQLSG